MCASTNRIEIPLEDGIILVAEQNTDPNCPRELYVGLEKDGVWVQDIAFVGQSYQYQEGGKSYLDELSVLIWQHPEADDYTDSFTIPIDENA